MVDSDRITIIDNGFYCSIHSPLLSRGLKSFGEWRRLFKEFKAEEKLLSKSYISWNSYTKLDNPKMMRLFWKLGAKPYHIDLKHNSIWFSKEFSNGRRG